MTKIYVVRHGETEGILAGRMEARIDSPLTNEGVEQAVALENRLTDVQFSKIYSSPSQRAVRTALIIKGHRETDITLDDHLYELDIPDWDGHRKEEIAQSDPVLFDQFSNHPELFHPTRGESFLDLQKRVIAFVELIQGKNTEENLLIVTHSGVIKMILDFAENKPLSEYWNRGSIPNGSLSIVRIEKQGLIVELEADISHLQHSLMV
ncbi:histidine phosphatase family protein [Paenibacillus sp. S29]|uniref:histidine phosphatase family protein n=1 Tax=Paenibacillus sp. S29 TaxID=3394611 RepID=UPI0039BEEC5D